MKSAQHENLIRPSIDSLLTKVENKYILLYLRPKRARNCLTGRP
jgi:DNA-directed RNA polymerase omega subunit